MTRLPVTHRIRVYRGRRLLYIASAQSAEIAETIRARIDATHGLRAEIGSVEQPPTALQEVA